MKKALPTESDFPNGTEFVIKEFDVPLAHLPQEGWFNWYGGRPQTYDVSRLKPGNHWDAESFDAWLEIVKASMVKS